MEQGFGDLVTLFLRRFLGKAVHQRPPFQPCHRQQAVGAVFRQRHRHVHGRLVLQHQSVEPHLRGFPDIVQFLPQTFAQFLVDFVLVDRVVHPVIDGHGQF